MTTAHVYQTYIRAELDAVWNALIDPAFTRQYFFGTAFAEPPVAGEPYRSLLPDGDVAVDGTIEVVEAPHRLVQTWHVRYDDDLAAEPPSRVTWTLEQAGPGLVLLRVVHGDLAFSPLTWASTREGWPYVLDGLKSVVETGSGLPPRDEAEPAASAVDVNAGWHRWQAVEANNSVWGLFEADPFDAEATIRAAYAAAHHWDRVPAKTAENEARALYMIGRAWLAAGDARLARDYGDRCRDTCEAHGIADFDLAYAHELRARALHALGADADAHAAWDAALAVPIADPEDEAVLARDLARAPWEA